MKMDSLGNKRVEPQKHQSSGENHMEYEEPGVLRNSNTRRIDPNERLSNGFSDRARGYGLLSPIWSLDDPTTTNWGWGVGGWVAVVSSVTARAATAAVTVGGPSTRQTGASAVSGQCQHMGPGRRRNRLSSADIINVITASKGQSVSTTMLISSLIN
ncbi:hypothetical protein KIN20_021102 [Parelaphostrongylus tenuis]|uniref:Uncharacterized protein n=1 Tax=Parelaphostrongylus tenuis TaxID=148309 RepID=A0AAD5QU90_PARTN|nr:hypothetical protein KIN20_021102 [Parelaphostrongylus tenuis]